MSKVDMQQRFDDSEHPDTRYPYHQCRNCDEWFDRAGDLNADELCDECAKKKERTEGQDGA